jgi:NAD(P)-dependent dehydrogenase (short-subunit alcohol dehydrogenase family)
MATEGATGRLQAVGARYVTRHQHVLEGATVLVVGGTGTLGCAISSAVASLGAHTVTLSRRAKAPRQAHAAWHIACDVTNAATLKRSIASLARRCPPLRAVANCAGYNVVRSADRYSPAELRRIVDVNLYGAMLVARFTIPLLKRAGGGKFINIASQAGLDPQAHNAAYSAAKAGLVAFGHAVSREVGSFGLSVLSVCPGDIDSPMMDRALKGFAGPQRAAAFRRQLNAEIPVGRFGTPAEIAEVVAELLVIETPFLTGAAIVAAGGRTCH